MNITRRITKFLLLAALALPAWPTAAAQEMYSASENGANLKKFSLENVSENAQLSVVGENDVTVQKAPVKGSASSQRLKIDYFGNGTKSPNPSGPKLSASFKAAPPSDVAANAEEWNISTNFYNVGASGFINFGNTIKVAIDGSDIYIQGLCLWLPDAWVHGTINGNEAIFSSGQLYGTYTQSGVDYDMYFVGFDEDEGDVADVVFTYSATTHKLTLAENMVLLIGADTSGGYYAYHINTVIAKEYVEPPVEIEIGADAVDPSAYIPIYGYYYEQSTTSQIIYPASMLSNFVPGQKIKSLTFYTYDASGIQFSGGQITATLGTTTNTYFTGNSALTVSGTTATATVVPTQGSTTLKIEFSTPIEYTEGANLIIQLVNTTTGNYARTNWLGVAYSGSTQYYSYSSRGNGTSQARRLQFLPKTTFELQNPPVSLTDELDFEAVEVGHSKTLTAYVENANSEPVTATVTATAPFSVASSTVTMQPGATGIDVTFTPTEANAFNGTLTVDVGGSIVTIALKGVGTTPGVIVVPDEDFFDGITYNWTDSLGTKHSSNLNEIATDPDQMIAMLKEIYTNKAIPGNFKRGYSATGGSEDYDDVSYAGVGRVNGTVSNNSISYSYINDSGWNIPGSIIDDSFYSSGYRYYAYMDPTQYKPYNEGLTLLLVEVRDDFEKTGPTTYTTNESEGTVTYTTFSENAYQNLRQFVIRSIKSVRVISSAKRTGSGLDAGTLFKIDADKLNKFYFIAKGQLNWAHNSQDAVGVNYCDHPHFVYLSSSNYGFVDEYSHPFLYHMFEQFSPVANDATTNMSDIYQEMTTNMAHFAVEHDCMAVVPLRNHQFQMYGDDSSSDDCQDVRDLMFFVPDYRMMKDSGRDAGSTRKFLNYNTTHQPSLGLFVIKQYAITGNQITNEDSYRLHLTWTSNLLDFLPYEQGQYDLYRVIINADGTKTYQAVGEFNPNTFEYYDTVPMLKNGQQVTYVVRGQDVEQFLDLQMSNEESYIIPGLDREEQLRIALNSDYYFCRYDAATQTNNYSNSVIANNTVGTNVKPSYLQNAAEGSDVGKFKFWRATLKTVDGEQVVDTENAVNFVTAWVSSLSATGGTLTYRDWTDQTNFSNELYGHGYHQNPASSTFSIANGEVTFNGLKLYDNFRVSVEENAHPSLYVYYVTLETAVPFDLDAQGTETSTHARSNTVSVPVYKTAMTMAPISATDVENDIAHTAPIATKFQLDARYSSRSEILGYYIYRWADSETAAGARSIYDDDGEDESPQGQAGNQGEYYTVAMNTDFTGRTSNFTTDGSGNHPDVTATFVDNFMANDAEEGDTYTYAPVVELFAPVQAVNLSDGSDRIDYNTYGGPQQMTAGGIITITPGTPVATADEFTPQTTTGTTDKCKYYYIPMTANVDLPEGYEIYKVRAWRQIDTQWLGEEDAAHFDRVSNDYLFETMGDEANEGDDIFVGVASEDGNSHHHTGLFGAKSLSAGESFVANFIVRVYFTKPNASKADGDAKYYIAEKQYPVTITDEIITGIANVKSNKQVAGVKYYNMAGIESDQPFDGVNIVVTRYTDGSTSTSKVIK